MDRFVSLVSSQLTPSLLSNFNVSSSTSASPKYGTFLGIFSLVLILDAELEIHIHSMFLTYAGSSKVSPYRKAHPSRM